MSRVNVGMNAIYQGGLTPGYMQGGAGFMDFLKKANNFVKDNQLISKAANIASALGADKFLDEKTGGLYSKGVGIAQQAGYGRRRRRVGGAKRKTTAGGRKRKSTAGGRKRR